MSIQIRRGSNALRLIGLFLLLGTAGSVSAAKTAKTTLTISESLTEKVACSQTPATKAWSCGVVAADSYTISAVVLLTGVDIATFTPATTFDLEVGNLHIRHPLSADPRYITGKTSATLTSSYTDNKSKKVVYQTVILKWTKSQLTVSINGKTADTTTPGWASIQADAYIGQSAGTITDTTSGSIGFGTTSVRFSSIPVTGTVVAKSATGKNKDRYPVYSVKINKVTVAAAVSHGIQATLGATTTTTNKTMGSQGGTIGFSNGPLAGVTVSVPLGALASNHQFTVSHRTAALTPRSGTFSGHVIDLQTDGSRHFDEPVQLTVPFTSDGTSIPVPYYIDTNGHLLACQVTGIDRQAGTITFESWHASPFTWILAHLGGAEEVHTSYLAPSDGFQVNNATYSTPYNLNPA